MTALSARWMGVGPEFVVAKGPWDGMVREQRKKNELFEQDYQANEYQWKKEERKQREDLNHCKDSISKSYGNQHKKKKGMLSDPRVLRNE